MRQLRLLKSVTDGYYKVRQVGYYKVRQLVLQSATGITKCDNFVTKPTGITMCDNFVTKPTDGCPHDVVMVEDVNYTFEYTSLEMLASSIELCGIDNSSLAERKCNRNLLGAVGIWGAITVKLCGNYTIDELAEINVIEENAEAIATHLSTVTSEENIHNIANIDDVALILEDLTNVSPGNKLVTNATLRVVSNIQNADEELFSTDSLSTAGASGIIRSLEAQLASMPDYEAVEKNIAVHTKLYLPDELNKGIGYFINNTSATDFEGTKIHTFHEAEALITRKIDTSIFLPPDIIDLSRNQTGSNKIQVRFIVYRTSKLFQSNRLMLNKDRVVGSLVISATVENVTVEGLKEPIRAAYLPVVEGKIGNHKCVFWDFTLQNGHGDWSNEGCYYNTTSDDRIVCFCNHLTNFAVISEFQPFKKYNITELEEVNVTKENAEAVAWQLSIITGEYNGEKEVTIGAIALILKCLTDVGAGNERVTDFTVNIVSNLQNVDDELFLTDIASTSSIIRSLEAQLASLSDYEAVEKNIAVHTKQYLPDELRNGIGYLIDDTSGTGFQKKNIHTYKEELGTFKTEASVFLPPEIVELSQNQTGLNKTQVSFIVYGTSKLFTSNRLKLINDSRIGSLIISATVEKVIVKGLREPIKFKYLPVEDELDYAECVFWDFTLQNGHGDWSNEGCYYNTTSDDSIVCFCDHLTNFAVIMVRFLPIIPVTLIAAVKCDETYSNGDYCFMKPGNPLYFGLLLISSIVLFINMVMFVLIIRGLTCQRTVTSSKLKDKSKMDELTTRLRQAISIMMLLGLTWIFGYFSIHSSDAVRFSFQLLFCVFNSLQGFVIFVFLCIRRKDVRDAWASCFCCLRTEATGSSTAMSNPRRRIANTKL
ncbi:adhesion G-protein coupled receptor G6-like [Antedon mediterranea]|uniref:adhesion G-protein coupled receptor G6-like n=1 Tax=Antedon mediterranea TaxID=105859 RepID=UPI003AF4EB17